MQTVTGATVVNLRLLWLLSCCYVITIVIRFLTGNGNGDTRPTPNGLNRRSVGGAKVASWDDQWIAIRIVR